MNETDKFFNNLKKGIRDARQSQLRFATCKEVNWDDRTMTAVGVADNLEYFHVQLGLGFMDICPANGAVCLIGILEGRETATFLISAQKVDRVEIKAENIVFNSGENGPLVVLQKLSDNLGSIKSFCEAIHTALPAAFSAIGAGDAANGATGAGSYSNAMAGKSITLSGMEDNKITH